MQRIGFLMCLVIVGFSTASSLSAEPKTADVFPSEDLKAEIPQYVAVMEEFGKGNLENAIDMIEDKLPRPFRKSEGPFEEDARQKWTRQFQVFAEMKPKFDSVDLIGHHTVSTGSLMIAMIGHGEFGPVLFRFRVFKYRGDWKLHTVSFQASWEHIEKEAESFTRLDTPLHYPLMDEPITQAAEVQTPANSEIRR